MLGQPFGVTFLSKKVMRLEFWQATSPPYHPAGTIFFEVERDVWSMPCEFHTLHQSCVLCRAAADFLASNANTNGCACEGNRMFSNSRCVQPKKRSYGSGSPMFTAALMLAHVFPMFAEGPAILKSSTYTTKRQLGSWWWKIECQISDKKLLPALLHHTAIEMIFPNTLTIKMTIRSK